MAQFKVKNPNIPKLNELARLSYNVRYWANEFRIKYGSDNRQRMMEAETELDKWLKENIELIPGTEKIKEPE